MNKRKKESMLSLRPFKRISRSRSRSPQPPPSSNPPAATPLQTVRVPPEIEATTPFPEVGNALVKKLWQEAFDRLPPKEQKTLQGIPDQSAPIQKHIDAMLTSVREKQQQCHKKQWTFRFKGQSTKLRDRVEKIIFWLDRYKQVGDVAVNSNPLMAGLPWAGVRFLLQAAVSESQLMTSLLLGIDSATYVLARCRAYECVYLYDQSSTEAEIRTQKALYLDLREMYTLVLEFLASANELYAQTTFGRALKAFWDIEEITSFDKKIKETESRLNKDAQNLIAARNQTVAVQILEELTDLKNLSDAAFRMDDRVNTLWMRSERDHRTKILKWVSNIPYEDDHYRARNGRIEGTGEWLLMREEYCEWTSSDQSMILWVNGIPGAGKTKLASKVIDEFQTPKPDCGVAYFYCSRKQSDGTPRDNPDDILRSFIRQLAVRNQCIHTSLSDIHQKKLDSGSSTLRAEECKMLILELTKAYSTTFLVLDALDESDKERRSELLDIFNDLIEESEQLKVLIFSRRDDDIVYQLEREKNIGIKATNNQNDIELFVKEGLQAIQKKRRNPLSGKLCQRITDVLFKKSQGMFQWAALQLHQISRLKRESDIEIQLGRLPSTLAAAYDEIFQQILDAEGSQPEIGRRALHWITAHGAASSDELVRVVCQNLDTDVSSPVDIRIEDVFDACRNLVVIHSGKCTFSHLSVREYIENGLDDPWTLPQAHATTAEVCLSVLCDLQNLSRFWENYGRRPGSKADIFERCGYPPSPDSVLDHLMKYAIRNFPQHLNKCQGLQPRGRLHRLYEKFFGTFAEPGLPFKHWQRTFDNFYALKAELKELGFPNSEPLYLGLFEMVCAYKLADYLEYELDHGRFHPQELQSEAVDVLAYVVLSTSNRTMRTLLDERVGGNNHDDPSLGKALIAAAYTRNATMVQLLLSTRVNVNIELSAGLCPCPLGTAVTRQSNDEVIKLLLEAGAEVNMPLTNGDYGSALCAAAANCRGAGNIKLLLEVGAEVNMPVVNGEYGSALCAAAINDYGAANIKLLLEAGAEVNMSLANGEYDSALCAVAYCCGADNIKLLLEAGAEVNMPLANGDYGSALCAAVANCRGAGNTKLLLEAGAEVNMSLANGEYGSALCAAAYCRGAGNIKLLLEAGAEVNMPVVNGEYDSALCAAAANCRGAGNTKLLLEAGAEVNISVVNGEYGSALCAAAINDYGAANIKLLLETGAEVNIPLANGEYGSALCAVAYCRGAGNIKLLLEAGTEVNMPLANGEYDSALCAVAYCCGAGNIKLLLEAGAEVNMPVVNGDYGSALCAAAENDNNADNIKLLLEAGAEVNMPLVNGDYDSALCAAATNWHGVANIKLLLEAGAEVNMPLANGNYGSALVASLWFPRRAGVVQILLDAGADGSMSAYRDVNALCDAAIKYEERFMGLVFESLGPGRRNSSQWEMAMEAARQGMRGESTHLELAELLRKALGTNSDLKTIMGRHKLSPR